MTLQNGLIYRQFSWWHHFKGTTLPFQLFLKCSHFQSLCFSKIVTHRLKSTVETLSLTFPENDLIDRQCWVLQDASDVSYSNGLKIRTKMVLEVDALPKHWQVNKFWKVSCKKLWQIIVLPPDHYYLVWYLSIDFCLAVPWKSFAQILSRSCNNLTTHSSQFFWVDRSFSVFIPN